MLVMLIRSKSNNRRSVSGEVKTLGGAEVSWASSIERCVTLPTAEAEYAALGEGTKGFLLVAVPFICVRVIKDNQHKIG